MTSLRGVRTLLGAAGVAVTGYGIWALVRDGMDDLLDVGAWLAGVVVVHDLALAPVAIGLAWLAFGVLPDWWRGPVTVGYVVLGSITLSAVPVLGRFGARSDNPTLLDRNYLAGWLVFASLVVVGVIVGGVRNRNREPR